MDVREQKAMEATKSSITSSFNEKDGAQVGDLDGNSKDTVRTWQEIFTSSSGQRCGFVESIGKATELLKKYELETTTKFCCYKSDTMFGAGGETGGVNSHMKGALMLVVSLRDVDFGFWSRLGCSGQNTIIFGLKGVFRVELEEILKNYVFSIRFIYSIHVKWSLVGIKKGLGHAQIGLF